MKFKLLLAGLIISGIFFQTGMTYAASKTTSAPTSFVYQAIAKYKQKNYTGCIQDMDYAINHGKASDVAYYYKALSYARLGMKDEARQAYESARQTTANQSIATYATHAISCIDDSANCDSSLDGGDITKFIMSGDFMHSEVKENMKNQAMERVKDTINNSAAPSPEDLKYINQTTEPTDKEIADAVRTFQKLGINPFSATGGTNLASSYNQNAEMAQLNALLGNNNNNSMMNLIPMMSAMQTSPNTSGGVNKEFVQAYMLNQMLPGFNFGKNDK